MTLMALTYTDIEKTASALVEYWKGRGMTHDRAFAYVYLRGGHVKDVVSDTFYLYYERERLVGLVAFVVYHGGVGEIRDEILFPWFSGEGYFRRMIGEVVKKAKDAKLRKVYSLALEMRVADYEALGFKKEGVLEDHFKEGEDLTIVSKFF